MEETKQVQETRDGIVNCASLNFRKAPAMDAEILHVLKEGTQVKILRRANKEWFKVSCEDVTGFVMSAFIEEQ